MTKLRDDGYLSTDSPVVAACFIDREFRWNASTRFDDEASKIGDEIYGVTSGYVIPYGKEWPHGMFTYPTLIPADVVAEVWVKRDLEWVTLLFATSLNEMTDWLRKHTTKGANAK